MQLKTIILKELRNLLRDKRALLSLFLPLIVFPLVYSILGTQLKGTEEKLNEEVRIYCNIQNNAQKAAQVQNLLEGVSVCFVDTNDPEHALKTDEIYAILDFSKQNTESPPIEVTITYNGNSAISSSAFGAISAALEAANTKITLLHLAQANIDPQILDNIRLSADTLPTNSLLLILAPMLIVSLLIAGGGSIAVDVFAGDAERGTMEQLLMTQVKRSVLLFGKILSVLIVSVCSACISIASYAVALWITPELTELFGAESSEKISRTNFIFLILSVLSLAVFIATILSFISIITKSSKSAQSAMSVISILPSIFSMVIMFMPTSETHPLMMTIPIYGTLVSLKLIFSNALSAEYFLLTNVALIILAGLMFFVCHKLFKRLHL